MTRNLTARFAHDWCLTQTEALNHLPLRKFTGRLRSGRIYGWRGPRTSIRVGGMWESKHQPIRPAKRTAATAEKTAYPAESAAMLTMPPATTGIIWMIPTPDSFRRSLGGRSAPKSPRRPETKGRSQAGARRF